jgi:ectoine hydroxylase-related dioxygenase (phytanoyl-CoA dioxygenase family)
VAQRWAEAKRSFWERGWTVVEGVLPADRVSEVAALAQEIGYRDLEGVPDTAENNYLVDRAASGQVAPRKVNSPYTRHAEFRRLVFDPALRSLVQAVIGMPMELAADQILMKPPEIGSAKPYHQDNAYFRCAPGDHVVTAWIALDDVDEENGCLRYIDGSHRQPILEHEVQPGEPHNKVPSQDVIERLIAATQESTAPVGIGGVVLHHSHTLHTSHVNRSQRWRRGYATHWAAADVTSESGFVDSAYFNRPGYPDLDNGASGG